jgi:hypothetical protein
MRINRPTKKSIAELKEKVKKFEEMTGATIAPAEVWFDSKMVCETFNISEKELHFYRRRNFFPCWRIGNKIYYQMLKVLEKNHQSFIIEKAPKR